MRKITHKLLLAISRLGGWYFPFACGIIRANSDLKIDLQRCRNVFENSIIPYGPNRPAHGDHNFHEERYYELVFEADKDFVKDQW